MKVRKWFCFPFTHHFGAGFDHSILARVFGAILESSLCEHFEVPDGPKDSPEASSSIKLLRSVRRFLQGMRNGMTPIQTIQLVVSLKGEPRAHSLIPYYLSHKQEKYVVVILARKLHKQ